MYDFNYSTCILYVEGLDLADMSDIAVLTNPELDTSRKAFLIRNTIRDYQETFTVIEKASCVPLFFFFIKAEGSSNFFYHILSDICLKTLNNILISFF